MIYNWYKIFNLAEFQATGLVSKSYLVTLEGVGDQSILVTKGNVVSMMYGDVMLPVEFLGHNPFVQSGYAVCRDIDDFIWLGVLQP